MKRGASAPLEPSGNLIIVRNRQRARKLRSRDVQSVAGTALEALGRRGEVCFHLVGAREMARVNWQFLQHEGSTDVITFDQGSDAAMLRGEIYISVPDAVLQAAEFGTLWQDELCRYVIHGLLHLAGYDDLQPGLRRVMKRHEERVLRKVRLTAAAKTLGQD